MALQLKNGGLTRIYTAFMKSADRPKQGFKQRTKGNLFRDICKLIAKRSCLLGLLAFMSVQGSLSAAEKMVPNAPIIDFKLPLFAENGYKAWEIQGAEGRYLNTNEITVLILTIKTYSGDESVSLESVISSPDAVIDTQTKQANGQSYINVYGQGFRVRGKDWTWDGLNKIITIREKTQVDFDQSLGILLK